MTGRRSHGRLSALNGVVHQGRHTVLSNLYNVIHGATHVLARGDTFCTDERLGFDTRRTHGLFSEFSWSGRN